ncbi:MAG: hypothetical protein OEY58_22310 [Gammaproteobacteria bacterium]|nr:hypothetical protein [Gammaproteobacteria bacterium]
MSSTVKRLTGLGPSGTCAIVLMLMLMNAAGCGRNTRGTMVIDDYCSFYEPIYGSERDDVNRNNAVYDELCRGGV